MMRAYFIFSPEVQLGHWTPGFHEDEFQIESADHTFFPIHDRGIPLNTLGFVN